MQDHRIALAIEDLKAARRDHGLLLRSIAHVCVPAEKKHEPWIRTADGLAVRELGDGREIPTLSSVEHAPADSGLVLLAVDLLDGRRATFDLEWAWAGGGIADRAQLVRLMAVWKQAGVVFGGCAVSATRTGWGGLYSLDSVPPVGRLYVAVHALRGERLVWNGSGCESAGAAAIEAGEWTSHLTDPFGAAIEALEAMRENHSTTGGQEQSMNAADLIRECAKRVLAAPAEFAQAGARLTRAIGKPDAEWGGRLFTAIRDEVAEHEKDPALILDPERARWLIAAMYVVGSPSADPTIIGLPDWTREWRSFVEPTGTRKRKRRMFSWAFRRSFAQDMESHGSGDWKRFRSLVANALNTKLPGPLPLTADERRVLQVVAEAKDTITITQLTLRMAEAGGPRTDKAVRGLVRGLEERRLLHRPRGQRSGIALTEAGARA